MGSEKKRLFDGKVAVITASTQGIGFAIARRLALEGASVVISSRRQVSPIFSLSRQTADRAETFPPFFLSFFLSYLKELSLPSLRN
jgi:enoyl-[acyl-carrier-protein] reductase (NADH)